MDVLPYVLVARGHVSGRAHVRTPQQTDNAVSIEVKRVLLGGIRRSSKNCRSRSAAARSQMAGWVLQLELTVHSVQWSDIDNELELCADELVVGGGVGWSYDRRRRRAAHFSSAAAAWLYGRRRRRQTGWESNETAHSPDRRLFLVLQVSAAGADKLTANMHVMHNFTVLMICSLPNF